LIVIAAGEDGHRQGGEEAVATRVGEVLGTRSRVSNLLATPGRRQGLRKQQR
jgi:hypothetical protein